MYRPPRPCRWLSRARAAITDDLVRRLGGHAQRPSPLAAISFARARPIERPSLAPRPRVGCRRRPAPSTPPSLVAGTASAMAPSRSLDRPPAMVASAGLTTTRTTTMITRRARSATGAVPVRPSAPRRAAYGPHATVGLDSHTLSGWVDRATAGRSSRSKRASGVWPCTLRSATTPLWSPDRASTAARGRRRLAGLAWIALTARGLTSVATACLRAPRATT